MVLALCLGAEPRRVESVVADAWQADRHQNPAARATAIRYKIFFPKENKGIVYVVFGVTP